MKKLSLLVLVLVLGLAPATFAGVIYDNGGPNQQNGNEMTNWLQAEDFTLGSTNTITDIHFWTIEDPTVQGYAGSIWYGIYTNAGGQPGTLVAGGLAVVPDARTFIQGGVLGFYDEYSYDLTIAPFEAQAGQTYWLALHNGDINNTTRAEVYWESTNLNSTETGEEEFLPGSSWANNGTEHAFYLTGGTQTPEPSSLFLLGSGIVGIATSLRKRLAR